MWYLSIAKVISTHPIHSFRGGGSKSKYGLAQAPLMNRLLPV